MALKYQKVDVNFQGLDVSIDDKQLPAGKYTVFDNLWMDKSGKIQKRYGLSSYPTVGTTTGQISEFGDNVVSWTRNSFKTHVGTSVAPTYTAKSDFVYGSYNIKPAKGNIEADFDYAECASYGVSARRYYDYTTLDGSGNPYQYIEISFHDIETKAIFYTFRRETTSPVIDKGTGVRIVGDVGYDYISIFMIERQTTDVLKYFQFEGFDAQGKPNLVNSQTLDTYTTQQPLYIVATARPSMDWPACVVALSGTPNAIEMYAVSRSTYAVNTITLENTYYTDVMDISWSSSGSYFWVAYSSSVIAEIKVKKVNLGLTSQVLTTVSYLGTGVKQVSIEYASGSSMFLLVKDTTGISPTGDSLKIFSSTDSGVSFSLFDSIPYANIAARMYYIYDHAEMWFWYSKQEESEDSTNIGICAARIAGIGGTLELINGFEYLLPSLGTVKHNTLVYEYVTSMTYRSTTQEEKLVFGAYVKKGKNYNASIVERVFPNKSAVQFRQWNESSLNNIAPNLRAFDGVRNHKLGFPYYPSKPSLNSTSGTGASYPAGDYGFRVCWVWVDSYGNISRSAPSQTFSYTVASSVSDIYLNIKKCSFWNEYYDGGYGYIEVYATETDGGLYYLDGTMQHEQSILASTSDSIVYQLQKDQDEIISQPLLYTTGGILEHIGPDAIKSFTEANGRVWYVSANEGTARYSKTRIDGEAPQFSDAFIVNRQDASNLTALSVLDDKVVAFSKKSTFVNYGTGPDETGSGTFETQKIPGNIGTSDANSVVLANKGIYFKAEKGIYLLSRDLSFSHVGERIESSVSQSTISESIALSDRSHIWFLVEGNSGPVWVYDEDHDLWSRNTVSGDSMALVDSVPHLGSTTGIIRYEDKLNYDNAICKLTSGWISFAGLQSFKKIRAIEILGSAAYAPTNEMELTLYTDFIDTQVETFTALNSTVTSSSGRYQWGVKPKVQRMEAMKFSIEFQTTDAGYSFSGISLEVGVLPGIYKHNRTKRVEGS